MIDSTTLGWQSYTPTWTAITSGTNTIGNGSITGEYCQIAKTVFFRITLTWGSTTTSNGVDWAFSAPVTPHTSMVSVPIGNMTLEGTSAAYLGDVRFFSVTQIQPRVWFSNATYVTNAPVAYNSPITFANGHRILAIGTYKAA